MSRSHKGLRWHAKLLKKSDYNDIRSKAIQYVKVKGLRSHKD